MDDASAIVGEDQEAIHDPERGRRDAEEVASDGLRQVVSEKGDPARRAGPAAPHVLLHGALGDAVTEEGQFRFNALGAPKGIFAGHASDEIDELARDRGSSPSRGSRLPLPKEFEALPMPVHDSLGLHEHEARSPVFPCLR